MVHSMEKMGGSCNMHGLIRKERHREICINGNKISDECSTGWQGVGWICVGQDRDQK
jgi:hypothetical protein